MNSPKRRAPGTLILMLNAGVTDRLVAVTASPLVTESGVVVGVVVVVVVVVRCVDVVLVGTVVVVVVGGLCVRLPVPESVVVVGVPIPVPAIAGIVGVRAKTSAAAISSVSTKTGFLCHRLLFNVFTLFI